MPNGKQNKGGNAKNEFGFLESDIRGWTLKKAFLFTLGLSWDVLIPPNVSIPTMVQILRGRMIELIESTDPELPDNPAQMFLCYLRAKGVEPDKARKTAANFAQMSPAPGDPSATQAAPLQAQVSAAAGPTGSGPMSVTDFVDAPANNAVETFADNWQDIGNAQGTAAKWDEIKDTAKDLGTGVKTWWNNLWK